MFEISVKLLISWLLNLNYTLIREFIENFCFGVVHTSRSEMTPWQEFRVLCELIVTGQFKNVFPSRKDLVCVNWTSSWRASTHHRVQGRQCAGHLAKPRHSAYLEYTHDIALQHQQEDPMGKPNIPYLQHQPYHNVSEEIHHQPNSRGRLTPASHL
ncbi:hypothetical protein TNCV_5004431 [Trichonephila clavipes]|uniref:Uncharacterized protein n=1 Tax=Trichonephila clavipes TaxID=2585209 RepID=A0A8X6V3N0_TRICX|nr:hypothetical protein TNCV_5004431 [Trichonephila clavipes]